MPKQLDPYIIHPSRDHGKIITPREYEQWKSDGKDFQEARVWGVPRQGFSANAYDTPAGMDVADAYTIPQISSGGLYGMLAERLRPAKKFHSGVFLLLGRRGSGKTSALTNFLLTQKQRFAAMEYPWEIWTNYHCTFSDREDPDLVSYLASYAEDAHDKEVGIDEIQMSNPNRRSLSTVNVNIGSMLTQVRKRHMSTWLTTQFPQVLDTWLLLQVDLFARCESFDEGRTIHVMVYDYWGQFTGNDSRKPWPLRPDWYDWDFWLLNPTRVWGLYDTDEMVVPLWLKNRADILGRTWDTDAEPEPDAKDREPIPVGLSNEEFMERGAKLLWAEIRGKALDGVFLVKSVLNASIKVGIIQRRGQEGIDDLCSYLRAHGCDVQKVDRDWVGTLPGAGEGPL